MSTKKKISDIDKAMYESCPLASGTCNDKTKEFSTQLKNPEFCRDKSHARSFFSVDSVVENQRARCIKKGGVLRGCEFRHEEQPRAPSGG